MIVRELRLSTGNKVGAVVLGATLLVLVVVFLAFGFVLFLSIAAVGLVVGIAAAAFRRLTGRRANPEKPDRRVDDAREGLDPAREISPPPR